MERMQNVLIDTAMVSVKALACSSVNSGVFETSSRNLSAENEPAALSSCWAAEPLTSGDFLTEVWAPVQEGMVAAVSLEHLVETFGWLLQGFSFGALLYFYLLVAGVHSQDFPSPFPALPHLLSYLLSALHPTLQLLSSSLHQPSSLFELFFRSPPSLHHLSHLRAWRCLGSKPARRQVQARGNANAESSSVFSSKLRLGCLPLQSKAWKGQLQIRICSTNCSSNGKHAKDIKWWSGNSSIPLDDPDRGKSLRGLRSAALTHWSSLILSTASPGMIPFSSFGFPWLLGRFRDFRDWGSSVSPCLILTATFQAAWTATVATMTITVYATTFHLPRLLHPWPPPSWRSEWSGEQLQSPAQLIQPAVLLAGSSLFPPPWLVQPWCLIMQLSQGPGLFLSEQWCVRDVLSKPLCWKRTSRLSSCWAAEPLTSGDFLTEVWAPVQERMLAAVSLEHLVETLG